MPGLSIHVVDVARGVVAAGMRVEVWALASAPVRIADTVVSKSGVAEDPSLTRRFDAGRYEALLHVGAYYARAGFALPEVPFLDVAAFRFGIDDPAQHYHLPFKLTPWGYSCFRGA
ncbi:MAG TPA: hydroxyisourate hydrolase [Casimicrobiaceae bacterium]